MILSKKALKDVTIVLTNLPYNRAVNTQITRRRDYQELFNYNKTLKFISKTDINKRKLRVS
jgi:hypothetical protein